MSDHDREECPHPEHGDPAPPDTMEAVLARCKFMAADTYANMGTVRAAGYVTQKGALVVGHYAEGYLRAYFIHSLN